mgnify:CR=1 FL=1
MNEITSPSCRSMVRKYKELAAEDIRFDVPLAEACFEDRQRLCATVPPVGRKAGAGGLGDEGLRAGGDGCVLGRVGMMRPAAVPVGGCSPPGHTSAKRAAAATYACDILLSDTRLRATG